jgi:uncharacterized protein (DUF169 family)
MNMAAESNNVEQVRELGRGIREALGLMTLPIGIYFCRKDEQCDLTGFRRPYKDLGIRVAFCQAINIVRTYGWSLAIGLEDSYCMVAAEALGLTDKYLDYIDKEIPPWHTADKGANEIIVSTLHERFLEPNSMRLVLLFPLERAGVVPHLVVIYGMPAQISSIAKALIWYGILPQTSFIGMASCTLIPRSLKSNTVQMSIPGSGELILGRTENYELSIIIPYDKVGLVLEGLKNVRRIHPYPLAKFSLYEPKVPSWYRVLTHDYYEERKNG